MKTLTAILVACLMLTGCAVRIVQCRHALLIDKKTEQCEINTRHPTDCIGTLWLKVKCPTENL